MDFELDSARDDHRDFVASGRSIRVFKEYLKFSAAHFLIFADGSAERMHGHNYRVAARLAALHLADGMVLDFKVAKDLLSDILARLDERVLLPELHGELTCRPLDEDEVEVRYRAKRYVLPTEDVVVLPISNTSSENLAEWIGGELWGQLRSAHPELELDRLEVDVQETPGQVGSVTLERQASGQLSAGQLAPPGAA